MKIIGLTGNSGSGKSTVSRILSEHGGFIIDADKIAHENIKKGKEAYKELIENFGNKILSKDDEIDRKKLGDIAFSNDDKLKLLNEISLKYILKKISDILEKINNEKNKKYDFVVIDAPLLIETGLNKIADETWVVCADYEIRLSRIIKRDDISREYAKKRLDKQIPQSELRKYGDVIIENNNIAFSELTEKNHFKFELIL